VIKNAVLINLVWILIKLLLRLYMFLLLLEPCLLSLEYHKMRIMLSVGIKAKNVSLHDQEKIEFKIHVKEQL
jgi:hypothetical protein